MRLIYEATGQEVKVGDVVKDFRGDECEVTYFRPPHKPSSQGKISIRKTGKEFSQEVYVGVIGAKWIEREDRNE